MKHTSSNETQSPFPDDLLKTLDHGHHALPGIWKHMLPEEFQWMRLPRERQATCFHCPEVACGAYRDDCRCCTYFPQVPNFMLGLALRDPRSEARVRAVVEEGHALPQGLLATPLQYRVAVTAYAEDKFGNLPQMLCPFVEEGSFHCLIYPYRNSICSTFFCRHDHGDTGTGYWNRLQALVGLMESVLAQWAVQEVGRSMPSGLSAETVMSRMDGWSGRIDETFEPHGAWSRGVREDLWGPYLGRELEFFDACAAAVTNRLSDLFEIACNQPYLEALELERAIRQWMPDVIRHEVPPVAQEPGLAEPVASHWYKLQLAHRRLWELPFNEGVVVLDDRAHVQKRALSAGGEVRPCTLLQQDERVGLTQEEAALLLLFEKARVLGETLFERPEIRTFDGARAFLAECLRKGILVHRP